MFLCCRVGVVHVYICFLFVFFCKQKTAYEMRISDWSSDVCSSDLSGRHRVTEQGRIARRRGEGFRHRRLVHDVGGRIVASIPQHRLDLDANLLLLPPAGFRIDRSEEHTSALQSLMRNSYAVFCLKKKNVNEKNKTAMYVKHIRM